MMTTERGITEHLSRRLLPLAIVIGLLISLVAPATYWSMGHKQLEHTASLYAKDLADKFRGLALDSPTLWKYQSYKFLAITEMFHPNIDILGFVILDEKGEVIPGYEYGSMQGEAGGKLPFAAESRGTKGSVPIFFNNHQIGSVEVLISDHLLLQASIWLFLFSALSGISLATLIYRFPLRVVRKAEKSMAELLARVQQSEDKFRSLITNIPDIVWSGNQQGKTLYISPNIEKAFGYSAEEILKEPNLWFGRIHPDDLERVKDAFLSLFMEGGSFDVEYRLQRRDGEWIWLHDRALGTYERDGIIYADGLFTEITARKEMEEILVQQRRELARSNTELEQFAYVASHDLQEPLRMVTSYMQLLSRRYRGKLDADADEFIAFAVDGAIRMQKLINDLLLYSRTGRKGTEPQVVDCNIILGHVLDNLQEAISESGAEIDAAPLPVLVGNELHLTQLLQNLIGNALKFRAKVPPRIEIRAQQQGEEWIFSVRDHGIGIESKDFTRIFQVFQRLHDRTLYPGTGIGLALCKKIVEQHGGRLWVESAPGEGATFFFALPTKGEKS